MISKKNIGFISTRFAGTDGVSMESSKWAEVLRQNGHQCFWFAGELDHKPENSFLVSEAHFQHEEIQWINERVVGKKGRDKTVTDTIHALRKALKDKIYEFIDSFHIDLLIVENALTIPMNVPLGLAITEFIAETRKPTIAHHHDFYWERTRFSINAMGDYIRMAFPPNLPNIEHVVINSAAKEELALRTGITSTLIPNVLDFENPPVIDDTETVNFRKSIGLEPDDIMILQPTRIVQRKGIEHAIELVMALEDPRCKLVVSHEAGDEGMEYAESILDHAKYHGVDLRLLKTRIADPLNPEANNHGLYSLWHIYQHADFITYPSLYEGFGNALLEAIYFKKPLLVNRYSVFVQDIEPKGFDLVAMNGYLTRNTIQKVRDILNIPERKKQMVETNYKSAARHYSYAVLRKHLSTLLTTFFGTDDRQSCD